MFRFTQEPSTGSQSQCLAKITCMVPLCLSIWTLSVLWRRNTDCSMCILALSLILWCLQDIPSTGLDCWYQLEARTQRSNVQGRIRLKLWLSTREDRGNSEEDNWSEIRQQERLHAIFISYELDHSLVRHVSFYAVMFPLSLFLIHSFLISPLLTWSMSAAFWLLWSR